jgi:hypothetical protein
MKIRNGLGRATSINVSVNTTLSPPTVALAAAVAGVINVTMAEDGTIILLPIAAGIPAYYEVKNIWASGTTATGVVAFKQHG